MNLLHNCLFSWETAKTDVGEKSIGKILQHFDADPNDWRCYSVVTVRGLPVAVFHPELSYMLKLRNNVLFLWPFNEGACHHAQIDTIKKALKLVGMNPALAEHFFIAVESGEVSLQYKNHGDEFLHPGCKYYLRSHLA
jgi:hypothetical protein